LLVLKIFFKRSDICRGTAFPLKKRNEQTLCLQPCWSSVRLSTTVLTHIQLRLSYQLWAMRKN